MSQVDLPALRKEDLVGRRVFSQKRARKAKNSERVDHRTFFHLGVRSLSVDRLGHADSEVATIADRDVPPESRGFFGWAALRIEEASRNGRAVNATPQKANRYHADIVLPEPALEERDELVEIANELAGYAVWRERPPV